MKNTNIQVIGRSTAIWIKKKKKFDMMVFPGVDHGMGGSYYVNLIHDYFSDNLK